MGGGTSGGGTGTGGGTSVDAYTKTQSDAMYAKKADVETLTEKVDALAAAVGAANEELETIIG